MSAHDTQTSTPRPASPPRRRLPREQSYTFTIDPGRLLTWIPAIVFSYLLLSPIVLQNSLVETTAVEQLSAQINLDTAQSNIVNQVFWVTVLFTVVGLVFLHAHRPPPRVIRLTTIWPLVAYLTLAVLSVGWALDPAIAFRRVALQIVVTVALYLTFLFAADLRVLLSRLYLVCAATVALNVIAIGLKPPSSLGFEGIYSQKNVLGGIAGIICIFSLFRLRLARSPITALFPAVVLFASFGLIILARAKTALVLTILVPGLAWALAQLSRIFRISPAPLIAALLLIVWFGYGALSAVFGVQLDDVFLFLFQDATFTGRTRIWDFVLNFVERRPWLGYGFGSFWGIGADAPAVREAPGFITGVLQAHNGYLDVLLETGAVGLFIIVCLIFNAAHLGRQLAQANNALAQFFLALLLWMIIDDFMESYWLRNANAAWMIFLMLYLIAAAARPFANDATDDPTMRRHSAPALRTGRH